MKRKTMLTIIGILIVVCLCIGISYSYYSANVKENNKTETVIKTNELNIIFTGTNEITTGDNMIPGDSFTKTFTVENTSSVDTTFNIYIEKVTNEFNEDLVYVLSDEDGVVVEETPLPVTNAGKTYLISDIEIASKELKTYTLKIEYKYLDTPQNDYQGATFRGTVGVDTSKVSSIKVDATDSSGNNLNATASNITGDEKENLLTSLEETGYIDSKEDVDALIEVESDDFEDLATTTFDVSSIAKTGDTVVILHFDEEKQEWEYIGTETVDEDGKVTGDFTSYSPVAFVVVKEDGTYENITSQHFNENIVVAYVYNEQYGTSNYCVTGNESTCQETTCYENTSAKSCASGTIVDYKVNNNKTVRFHVMYDNGSTMTLQTQKNTIYNTWWISIEDYKTANTDETTCAHPLCTDEGPVTILNALESETNNWDNVNKQVYTLGTTVFKTNAFTDCSNYNSCTKNTYTMPLKVVNARIITVQEATDLGCDKSGGCPIWMHNYLKNATQYGATVSEDTGPTGVQNDGYWTMNTFSNNAYAAWHITYGGSVTDVSVPYNPASGARAVVEINK